jgi:N-acetylglutamate synthase-like GNAT family acetyltransferase
VVEPAYQKQGIGNFLIDAIKSKARDLGFSKLYLFAFDSTIPDYYTRLGWIVIGMDEFKGHPCHGDGGRVMKRARHHEKK